MSKHKIEVEIPDGPNCDGHSYENECPFFNDERCSCSNPEEVKWKKGDPVVMCNERPRWCIEKYGMKEGE